MYARCGSVAPCVRTSRSNLALVHRCCLRTTVSRSNPRDKSIRQPQLLQASFSDLAKTLPWWPQNTSKQEESNAAVQQLLDAVDGLDRGLLGTSEQRAAVLQAVDVLAQQRADTTTTGPELSATWRLVWTTEKETLFILANAGRLGTQAGEVYQVIDLTTNSLQNVILFPPEGAFIVNSSIEVVGDQRTKFQFSGVKLKLPKRVVSLPPFGKGWFDTVYVDDQIRVARDIRGDTLVVARDGPPRTFA